MPGTPTERPLNRAELNGSGAPFSQNESTRIAAGAVSRWSIDVTEPLAVRSSRKPPPPMPHENGSVTPSTAAAVIAASTAFPPPRRVSTAAWVASVSTVAAAPPVPIAVGGPVGAVAAAAGPASARMGREAAVTSEQSVARMSPPRDEVASTISDPAYSRCKQG